VGALIGTVWGRGYMMRDQIPERGMPAPSQALPEQALRTA
jgi:hypothetical protein